jgi:hypothetical protein
VFSIVEEAHFWYCKWLKLCPRRLDLQGYGRWPSGGICRVSLTAVRVRPLPLTGGARPSSFSDASVLNGAGCHCERSEEPPSSVASFNPRNTGPWWMVPWDCRRWSSLSRSRPPRPAIGDIASTPTTTRASHPNAHAAGPALLFDDEFNGTSPDTRNGRSGAGFLFALIAYVVSVAQSPTRSEAYRRLRSTRADGQGGMLVRSTAVQTMTPKCRCGSAGRGPLPDRIEHATRCRSVRVRDL